MEFETLFRHYWWLLFPLYGLLMGAWGMAASNRRTRAVLDLIKSYVDQGKDPPPELLNMAGQSMSGGSPGQSSGGFGALPVMIWAAMAAGFGTAYYVVRAESFAFAFLLVAVVFGVLAVGGFVLLASRPKS